MKTYHLASNPLVYTPGLVEWGINGWAFEDDRPNILKVFTEGYSLPESVARKLLNKEILYSVEDEAVVFTVDGGDE